MVLSALGIEKMKSLGFLGLAAEDTRIFVKDGNPWTWSDAYRRILTLSDYLRQHQVRQVTLFCEEALHWYGKFGQ